MKMLRRLQRINWPLTFLLQSAHRELKVVSPLQQIHEKDGQYNAMVSDGEATYCMESRQKNKGIKEPNKTDLQIRPAISPQRHLHSRRSSSWMFTVWRTNTFKRRQQWVIFLRSLPLLYLCPVPSSALERSKCSHFQLSLQISRTADIISFPSETRGGGDALSTDLTDYCITGTTSSKYCTQCTVAYHLVDQPTGRNCRAAHC